MNSFKKRLIHLHHCRGVSWKSIFTILKNDPSLSNLYFYSSKKWLNLLNLPQPHLNNFIYDLHNTSIDSHLQQYSLNEIECITIFEDEYPYRLKEIYNPPWVLYIKGKAELLNERKMISIVGPRKPSSYGTDSVKSILPPLIKKGYVIVSGLAKGIDAMAHMTCLKHSGKTIGVLGSGLFHIYPKENLSLGLEMMKQGVIISEYPPFKKPEPWMFPHRNRIVSGISEGVLVIEAKEKSGSLITAMAALEQGREVFALPGNITSELSLGTNRLIQDGAKLVLKPSDIEDELLP